MKFCVNMDVIKLGTFAWSRCLPCALCLCVFASRAALAQNSAQRDQHAVTILTQTIAACGGQDLLAAIQDFTETGTVTYYWADQITGNVTVKGRGLHQLKIEADLPAGKHTAVVNRDGGSLIDENGAARPISRQSAHDLESSTLPYLPLITALQDSSINLIYAGLVTHEGAQEYDIRLQKIYTQQQDPSGNQGAREARDFYIDPKTYLVTAISDLIHFGGPNDQGVPHEVIYSNYQAENGIMVPLTIEQTAQNSPTSTLTLNQATFNSGLTDTDFTW